MATFNFRVNGSPVSVDSWDPDQPLLYVLRNALGLHGPKFGCGMDQCGACTVLIDGKASHSCTTPVQRVAGRSIMTLEGLGTPEKPDKVQAAFIAEQAAQCGYCTNGFIMRAKALLDQNPHPTDAEAKQASIRQLVPLWHPHQNPERRHARGPGVEGEAMQTLTTVSRRQFLKTGGAVVVSFTLSPALLQHGFSQSAPGNSGGGKDPSAVDSFLAIHADGTVTLFTSRVDVGTGLEMVMRQVAAEELDIPVERFTVVEGDTLLTPDHGGTGGSRGVPQGAARVRLAAATARRAILDLGAAQLKLPASDLTIAEGMVRPKTGGRGVAVGSVVGDKQLELEIDSKAPLKEVTGYRVVGKPLLRADVPAKCTGKHVYVQDLTLPGMLHARVIRPPAIGAALLSVDEASLRGIPDVRVVRIQNFLAVVAKDEWAALRASRELKAQWSDWGELPESGGFDQFMLEAPIDRDEPVASEGNFDAALPTAARQLSATYYWPFQSHASLGPSCGVADFRESGTTVWTSSQGVFGLRNALARTFAIPREKLRVIYLDGSGSYGTNAGNDASADALLLSKTLGAPVRVQWSRQDEIGWDPKGPAQLLKLRGGLGPQNNILAWESQMWLPSGPSGERALVGPESAGIPQPQGQGAGLMTMNADPPYAASNVRVTAHFLKGTPLRLSNLRAPGKIANVFAVESFTDEMAAAAGMDPVEFRLRGLKDPRALAVIRRAAEMIGWQSRISPNPGVRTTEIGGWPRFCLCPLQAAGKLCRHGDGSCREPRNRRNRSSPRGMRARLWTDHEPRWPSQSGGRQYRADPQPDSARRGNLRPVPRHQRGLAELPNSDLPGSSRG